MGTIRNPVLAGFHPDPSFCRVGDDVFIATSTFEWYPGVLIYRSRDLVSWELVARPLDRASLLDMRGNPDGCGIWAPCLSHDGERFYLVYTDMKRNDGAFRDAHNYITSAAHIDGPWCEPWYINSSGFDPSLFHDADGRKYVLNLQWNHRGRGTGANPRHTGFDGLLLQGWSPEGGLTGPVSNIWPGTARGLTEAPHLFRRNGYYYLTTAEGGTDYGHAVTMARARDIRGPYETHPHSHLMSTADAPAHPLQRVGHGQYIELADGSAYHTFLMSRPVPGADGTGRFSILGRESGIERCVWGADDWLYLEKGGLLPRESVPVPWETPPPASGAVTYAFGGDTLPADFQWLRTPCPQRLFRIGDGALTLFGRESLGAWFEQALVARRQQHFLYEAEVTLDFAPDTYQQGAGLIAYYNRQKFHAAIVSHDPELGRSISIISCLADHPDGALTITPKPPLPLGEGPVDLRVGVDHHSLRFAARTGGGAWMPVGPVLDATILSDEAGRGMHKSFTGAFVGMVAFDMTGQGREARFSRFSYRPG
ncbi:MAG: glycoside hydrolase family 43 protein [Acuticoccus sp.]